MEPHLYAHQSYAADEMTGPVGSLVRIIPSPDDDSYYLGRVRNRIFAGDRFYALTLTIEGPDGFPVRQTINWDSIESVTILETSS